MNCTQKPFVVSETRLYRRWKELKVLHTLLSLIGVLLGLGLATIMAPFLPNSVPSFMTLKDNLTISVSFILTSILCGALSLVKIKKVDPIEVIGGNGE